MKAAHTIHSTHAEAEGSRKAVRGIERPGRRSRRTRRDLVLAAEAILSEQGVEGLTVRAVTDRADVGHGTFYHHFPSTEALLAEAIEASMRALSEEMQKGFADADDKVFVFFASLSRQLRMLAAHPALAWMVERPHVLASALREACGPFAQRDVEAMVAAGDVSTSAPLSLGGLWQWVFVGALVDIASGSRTVDQVEDDLRRFLLFALGIPADRARKALDLLDNTTSRGSRP